MKRIFTIIASLFSMMSVQAQNITDIVRWSQLQPAGTATSLGVNNAIGAMGGDIMSVYVNPAGIGEYKKSVINFSAGMDIRENSSFLLADANAQNRLKSNNFSINNVAFVIGNYRPNRNFTSSNFAIGFTRLAGFKDKFYYKGKTIGTMTEFFAERANTLSPAQLDDFVAYPAYNTGAIFDFDEDKFYETDFAQDNLLVTKEQNVVRSGRLNELSFTWAGEYKDKVNIGLGIGVPFGEFTEQKVYIESDPDNEIATFNRLKYIENLSISGRGFNARLGLLFKPATWLRIGGAFHSPTWFTFNDVYSTSLEYSYDNVTNVYPGANDQKPELQFKYKINNPWKAIGSVGSVFNLGEINGFVNLDVEYIDYLSAEYDGTAYSNDPGEIEYTNSLNQSINNTLKAATNLRLGVELAYDIFRFRGGVYQFESPFNNNEETSRNYTLGAGFRGDRFFIDFAMQFANNTTGYNAYTVTNSSRDPLVNINARQRLALLTFGFKI